MSKLVDRTRIFISAAAFVILFGCSSEVGTGPTSGGNRADGGGLVTGTGGVTAPVGGTQPSSVAAWGGTGGASGKGGANGEIAGTQSVDTAATGGTQHESDSGIGGDAERPNKKAFQFAVFSDPHYYDTDLGTSGPAFDAYLAGDRKLLPASPAILDSTIDALLGMKDKLDFVIVSGDLTKDGERTGHEKFTARIRALEASGLQVFVCPGNHDINNPNAVSYLGDAISPVDHVTPRQFAEIYADFGYGQAIERDADSLSYLAEPAPGLWVIAIDSCMYQDNLSTGESAATGALRESTLSWIEAKVAEAKQKGKRVLGFMHHGLVEHFTNQSVLLSDYVVDNWSNVSRRLSEAGLKLVFTGHFHAQDVTRQRWIGSDLFLFDVETGSLLTYPDPYRIVSIDAQGRVEISSRFIQSIVYDTSGLGFPEYSRRFLVNGFESSAPSYLQESGVPDNVAQQMIPVGIETIIAHYSGDENPSVQSQLQVLDFVISINPAVSLAGSLLQSLQTDLEPPDNDVVFNIETGEVE
jgi:3',5'-cyclic AMP phosphodiesterase CpdA